MCAIGLPVDTGISALPSIIGPGLGAIPPAEIAQHRGLRRERVLFGRHACHSTSKSRAGNRDAAGPVSGHDAGLLTSEAFHMLRVGAQVGGRARRAL